MWFLVNFVDFIGKGIVFVAVCGLVFDQGIHERFRIDVIQMFQISFEHKQREQKQRRANNIFTGIEKVKCS